MTTDKNLEGHQPPPLEAVAITDERQQGEGQTAEILPEVPDDNSDIDQRPNWLRRNLFKISAGTFLGGTAVTAIVDPLAQLEHAVVHTAPWVIGGGAVTETAWIGGFALMAASAGKKIGNPLKLKSRFKEITSEIVDSKAFRTGLNVNTIGAIGTAGVVAAGAVAALPPETWPGAFGIVAADLTTTALARIGPYASIREARKGNAEKNKSPKITVRHARLEDIDRLADIDLELYDTAYGTSKPDKKDVVSSFTKRFHNARDWMFVAEANGVVEGFVTAFKTDRPMQDFQSWEQSTANGTLEDKVKPTGKYVYVVNMTIKHEAVKAGAQDMLLANLFANSIREGVEYGYFVSRMPHFRRWLEGQGITPTVDNTQQLAEQYLELRREEDGKIYDPQLRMYNSYGYKQGRMVPNAFEDHASLNYGILFSADIPPSNALKAVKPVRILMASALRRIARNPKLLNKVF